jgi:hypothetical protein
MELESSSPYTQAPATCPYPEPTPPSPHDPLQLPFYGCVVLLLETLPLGDPNAGVVYLRNILSPEEASLMGNS